MSASKAVLDQALKLPRDQRAGVARELIASLDDPAEEGVEGAWLDEAERRQREAAAGTVPLEDWSEVRERIASRLRSLRR